MLTRDIVLHMMRHLPRRSERFSDYVAPSAVSVADGVVTMTVANNKVHAGEYVCVTHARVKNTVDSYTVDSGKMTIAFDSAHDFTTDWQETIMLKSDTTPSINGDYTIDTVEDRYTVTITTSMTALPADTYASEIRDYSINGIFKLKSATQTEISYDLEYDDCAVPDGFSLSIDASTVRIHNSIRVTRAATIEKFMRSYRNPSAGKLWAVVTPGRNTVSQSGSSVTDEPIEQTGNSNWSIMMTENFAVNIVAPCDELSGAEELDTIESVRPSLYATLLGKKISSGFARSPVTGITPRDDGAIVYSDTSVISPMNFYQIIELGNEDVSRTDNSAAMNALNIDFLNNADDNDNVIMSLSIQTRDEE